MAEDSHPHNFIRPESRDARTPHSTSLGVFWYNPRTKMKKVLKIIWDYYKKHKRSLPWRETKDPYKILVSEMMLQQTQVSRVLVKYTEFLKAFPTLPKLHNAPMSEVLRIWKGLGYNRRAFYLKRIADEIVTNKKWHGKFPHTYEEMLSLPGIGQSTAGAITAFAFEEKIVFIETNIRIIFLYHFFKDKNIKKVTDVEIQNKLEEILKFIPKKKIRDFYYALYDYGTYLKAHLSKNKEHTKISAQSAHYKKQSKFIGSSRQLRAIILQYILEEKSVSGQNIIKYILKMAEDGKIPFPKNNETLLLTKKLIINLKKEKLIGQDAQIAKHLRIVS